MPSKLYTLSWCAAYVITIKKRKQKMSSCVWKVLGRSVMHIEKDTRTFTLKNMIPLSNTARPTASQISFTVHKDGYRWGERSRCRTISICFTCSVRRDGTAPVCEGHHENYLLMTMKNACTSKITGVTKHPNYQTVIWSVAGWKLCGYFIFFSSGNYLTFWTGSGTLYKKTRLDLIK